MRFGTRKVMMMMMMMEIIMIMMIMRMRMRMRMMMMMMMMMMRMGTSTELPLTDGDLLWLLITLRAKSFIYSGQWTSEKINPPSNLILILMIEEMILDPLNCITLYPNVTAVPELLIISNYVARYTVTT